jgi:hypothetical protein
MSLPKTLSLTSTVLIGLALLSMWIAFSIMPDAYTCDDSDGSVCFRSCANEKLPGEAEYLTRIPSTPPYAYELQPWHLGDRTCAWFDQNPARCTAPHKGDMCFDLVNWKDPTGKTCEDWTKHIRKEERDRAFRATNAQYSPEDLTGYLQSVANISSLRELGDNPLCHTPPPWCTAMSTESLREMRDACCVCGAHRDERNYEGSLSLKHPGSFKKVNVPPQHRGKKATHLTQCCKCDSRGYIPGIMPKPDGNEDNMRMRGGTWTCKKTKNRKDKDFIMGEPNVTRKNIEIAAITLTFAFAVSVAILVYLYWLDKDEDTSGGSCFGGESEAGSGEEDASGGRRLVVSQSRFLLRL